MMMVIPLSMLVLMPVYFVYTNQEKEY